MIYFALNEMTHLRYFAPLAIAASKQGLRCEFLIHSRGKYNCVSKHFPALKSFCKSIGAAISSAQDFNKTDQIIFCVEGAKGDHNKFASGLISLNNRIFVLTYQADFYFNYYIYKDFAEKIFLPSQYMIDNADKYKDHPHYCFDSNSSKNFPSGVPKYDVKLVKDSILQKYNLSLRPKVLFVFPNPGIGLSCGPLYSNGEQYGLTIDNLTLLYSTLHSLGFEILVKSRGKHPLSGPWKSFKGDHYLVDASWFPHTTMELIEICDLVINVDSTTIKEAVLGHKPILNFSLRRPEAMIKGYDFLYNYDYCKEFDLFPNEAVLREAIQELSKGDFSSSFNKSISSHLFEKDKVCDTIFQETLI